MDAFSLAYIYPSSVISKIESPFIFSISHPERMAIIKTSKAIAVFLIISLIAHSLLQTDIHSLQSYF